jgi:hypothetical membrane protein
MKYTNRMIAGMLLITGATVFLLGFLTAEALYPGYHSTQVMSDLGVGPTALLFNATIAFFGICVLAGTFLLVNTGFDRYFTLFLAGAGIGLTGVGIFPETAGIFHVAAAGLVFISGSLCGIAAYRTFRGPWSWIPPALGIVSLAATVLLVSGIYFGLGKGGMERVIFCSLIVFTLGSGGYLMSPGK